MTHWPLSSLKNPAMRAQAEAQLRSQGTVRVHKCIEDQPLSRIVEEVKRRPSKLEATLAQQIRVLKLPEPKLNYRFCLPRLYELDFAWPDHGKIAVEIQGMQHRVKARFKNDILKRQIALFAGWKLLEVGGDEIRSGQAVKWLEDLLKVPHETSEKNCK